MPAPEGRAIQLKNGQTIHTLDDGPVLVVVVNDPVDLARAQAEGWYRIPLDRAPRRVAADYLAFYQTGAFAAEERWSVRWLAPVRGYGIASRGELLPSEATHPRASDRYYRVDLGPLVPLPRAIPSRRLRRITFIPTSLARLSQAEEINDLWLKGHQQERLWAALKQADLEAERQYPLREDLPQYVADFAVFCRVGRVAVFVTDEPRCNDELREIPPPGYLLAAGGWTPLFVTLAESAANPAEWTEHVRALVQRLGGPDKPPRETWQTESCNKTTPHPTTSTS